MSLGIHVVPCTQWRVSLGTQDVLSLQSFERMVGLVCVHMTGRRCGERQAACGRCSELLLAEFVRLAAYGSSERDLRRKLLSPRPLRHLHLARTLAQQARWAARLGAPRSTRPRDLEGFGTGRVGGMARGVAAWHASPRDPYPSPRWGRGSARSACGRRGSRRHAATTRSAEHTVRTSSACSTLANLQPACGASACKSGLAVSITWGQPAGALHKVSSSLDSFALTYSVLI